MTLKVSSYHGERKHIKDTCCEEDALLNEKVDFIIVCCNTCVLYNYCYHCLCDRQFTVVSSVLLLLSP